MPESFDSQRIAPVSISETRPLYWSVRRELWENRSIYIAPLSVAGVVLFGFMIGMFHLPAKMRTAMSLDPAKQHAALTMPYDIAAFLILLTAFFVEVFYCLDALHGERRDRSILFWKSLPVSDLTTVLSKACIPLVVMPFLVFAIAFTTRTIMLLLNIAVLKGSGLSPAPLLAQLQFFQSTLAILYAFIVIALWRAPIYGWLLLISGWARRATFLWAVLPVFAIGVVEKLAFNTPHIPNLLKYRLLGWFTQAFVFHSPGTAPLSPLASLAPGKFLSTPGLWVGLAVAAIFLAAAVRLRRYREPI
jgi:ABC-2 type transport system permease protein